MRRLKYIAPAFVVFALAPIASESASAAPEPTGIWLDDTGRGAVEIKPCGNALCGNVVWVKSTGDAKGCGKQIIGDVAPVGNGRWDNGWIYSPERGRKYDVELKPLDNGTLRVTGYAGVKFLSKTMIWTRAPQDLQLCGQTEAKAETPAVKSDATSASVTAPAAAAAAPAPAPQATADVKPDTSPQPATAAGDPGAQAPAGDKSAAAKSDTAPANSQDAKEQAATPAPQGDGQAANEGGDDDKGIGKALGNLKLGDLDLDKVLTRTKSGKCKLDLPWFKVQFNCEHQ